MSETGVFLWVTGNVDTILSVLTLCVAAWATCVASKGLTTWKKQMAVELDKELAQKIWTALSDYRRALRLVPEPYITADDLKWLPAEDTSVTASLDLKWKRYFQSRRLVQELERAIYPVAVIWGEETTVLDDFELIREFGEVVGRKLSRWSILQKRNDLADEALDIEGYLEDVFNGKGSFQSDMEKAFRPLEETLARKTKASRR
ncbi:MAG: hypothetical protein ACRBBT_03390 [Paracoccaceae bacterium]